ncbi:MAG: hypothetical protein F6K47_37405 [Symploca sp. SIO2E6]|nr:hypothetical protein [Symploca sp. SIO2E6]
MADGRRKRRFKRNRGFERRIWYDLGNRGHGIGTIPDFYRTYSTRTPILIDQFLEYIVEVDVDAIAAKLRPAP